MADPKNEAFIDLEDSLTGTLVRAWNKSVSKRISAIERALRKRDYELAHKLADTLDFESIDGNTKLIETLGASALFLGASRHEGDVKDSKLTEDFPQQVLDSAVAQYITLMKVNAQEAVRLQAHILITKTEQSQLEDADQVIKAEDFYLTAQVSKMGADMFQLSSNMTVSRLNSFGFLAEASLRGITTYQVDEVLDSRTCAVCQAMHGTTFDVSTGLAHAQTLLTTSEPDALKSLAPWPKQDAASVNKLSQLSPNDKAAAGLNIPPYHPRCRGIVTVAGTVVEENKSLLGDHSLFYSGLKRPTTLTDFLFGEQKLLEAEAKALLGVNALGTGVVTDVSFGVGVAIGITIEELLSLGYTQDEAEALYRDSGGV